MWNFVMTLDPAPPYFERENASTWDIGIESRPKDGTKMAHSNLIIMTMLMVIPRAHFVHLISIVQPTLDLSLPIVSVRVQNLPFNLNSNGFHGCIRRFKLGYREVKIQSSSEPLTLRRIELLECGTSPCAAMPCKNHGTCATLSQSRYSCTCPPLFAGSDCEDANEGGEDYNANPCLSSPCEGGGICTEKKNLSKRRWGDVTVEEEEEGDVADFVCECPQGKTGSRCEEQGNEDYFTSILVL